jgi:hypothetical protein
MSTRTKVVLTKLVVFSPNDLVDDRLCVLIPMLCPAAVTNPDGDFGTTKNIALIGRLAESDPLIASGDAEPRLQKSQRCTSGASDMVPTDRQPRIGNVPRVFAPMCELLHTVSANQTCSSVDPSFGAGPGRAECAETADN